MPGAWTTLRTFLIEAKSAATLKAVIMRYIMRRYGENEADEFAADMKRMDWKSFKRHIGLKYMDSNLDSMMQQMAQAARVQAHGGSDPDKKSASASAVKGPSGRVFASYDDEEDKQAKIDAMRAARAAALKGTPTPAPLMNPNKTATHAVGTAGTLKPKDQPSVAAGIRPQDIKPNQRGGARSGLIDAQRQVDRATKEKGEAEGNRIAKLLGVPTTSQRTAVDPETGKKRVQIWPPDRVMKFMDPDQNPDISPSSDAEKRAKAIARGKGELDSDRVELIKRGMLSRMKAGGENDASKPKFPGNFHGERRKRHGMSRDKLISRPDQATGNWKRSMGTEDPSKTGIEWLWDDNKQEWITDAEWQQRYPSNPAVKRSSQFVANAQARAAQAAQAKAGDDALQRKVASSPAIAKGYKPAVQPAPEPDDEDDEYPEDQGWRKVPG